MRNFRTTNSVSVIVESPLYLLHLASEVQDKFGDHLGQVCAEAGLQMEEREGKKNVVLYHAKMNKGD